MTTRKYVGRAWSPARTLSVLDLKGRLVEMLSHAERQGRSDHMELSAKLLARPTHRDPPELERTEALQHFDRLVEDAEALTTAFEAMESDAASICCSMEAEGIVEASQRARAAFEGRRRNRTAGRIKWRVAVGCKARHADAIEGRLDDIAVAAVAGE
jgi:hypothetical protein